MKLILFISFFLLSCAQLPSSKKHTHPLSVLQLYTTDTSVEFNVLVPKKHGYKFSVVTPKGESVYPSSLQLSEFENSDWAVQNIAFTDLTFSDEVFRLKIESVINIEDTRNFKLFSQSGEKLSFAVGSCADERQPEKDIYQQIQKQKPDWLFLIGDTHYATQLKELTPLDIWESAVRARQQFNLYHLPDLIPTHATWDDNDYGIVDGGKTFEHKEASQHIFKAFFRPQILDSQIQNGPGISSRLLLRGMHFTFLDNRSFRGEPGAEEDHFGQEQEDWFFSELKNEALPTWIITGDQFFGGYHEFESFEGNHPHQFDRFVTKLKEIQTPFVFVSGDRHLSEIMQFPRAVLGQLSFEFTSSPLHAKTYPGTLEAKSNPWRVVGVDGVNNFMLFETQLEEQSWHIKPKAISSDGTILFERDLRLTTERLKDFDADKPKRRRYRRARWRRR